jgi:hypothetical protein
MGQTTPATIQDILGQIEKRLKTLEVFDTSAPTVSLDPLSEVGLYISRDKLLADLYRQYLEAQRNYIISVKRHGAQDAMTEIAQYTADSAYCAMETRLIELRGNPEMQVQIERVQKKQRAAYESDMKKRQEEYARRGITQPDGISQQTRHKETNKSSNMLWFMFMISMMEQEMERSRATRMHFARAAA